MGEAVTDLWVSASMRRFRNSFLCYYFAVDVTGIEGMQMPMATMDGMALFSLDLVNLDTPTHPSHLRRCNHFGDILLMGALCSMFIVIF